MVRAYQSALLTLAMFVAFREAPFQHTHLHESAQHHAGAVFHFHFRAFEPSGSGPRFQGLNPDDHAQFLNLVSLTPAHLTPVVPAIPNGRAGLPRFIGRYDEA